MKGEDKQLVRFIEGNDKCFIIPLYQRNYDWEIKHCRHLFSDLVKLHKENGKSHFLAVSSQGGPMNIMTTTM